MKRHGRAIRSLVLLTALGLALVAFAAYKWFAGRTGEAAVALIPSDASFVMTLDTNPSPQQVAAFTKIATALKQEGLLDKLDDTLSSMADKSPLVKQVRPYVSHNMAMATWASKPDTPTVIFLALEDKGKVEEALKANATYVDATDSYSVKDSPLQAALVSNYLVLANKPELFARVRAIQSDKTQSLASKPEYLAARASLPADCNLMCLADPKLMGQLGGRKVLPNSVQWMAWGLTVRDEGLALSYRCPMDIASEPALKVLAETDPVDPQVLHKLPIGAYGVIEYAEPGKWLQWTKDQVAKEPNATKDLDKFESETGISLDRDVIPALQGNVALAMYPGVSAKPEDLDGMIYLDNSHGGHPAELVQKLIAYAKKNAEKENKPFGIQTTKRGNATVYHLDEQAQAAFSKDLLKSVHADTEVWKSKTPIYVELPGGVAMVSSDAMLNKALGTLDGTQPNLSEDPPFIAAETSMIKDSQTDIVVSLSRIMNAMRPQLEKNLKGSKMSVDDLVNLFGGPNAALVGSGRYDGQTASGSLLLPLDFARAIHALGSASRSTHTVESKPMPTDVSDGA